MSSRTPLAPSRWFQTEHHRRTVVQLQTMIADFDRQADSLDGEVRIEENRANNHNPSHFAYPTYAKATIQRRDNLRHSSNELKAQLDAVKKALAEAELAAVRLLDASQTVEMHATRWKPQIAALV
jgi:flagellar FliJ protein